MSKNITDNTKTGVVYSNISDMSEDNTPTSTQIHNHIAHQGVSRRRKIMIMDDDQQNRKLKIKKRLLEKLKAKKAKKSS